MWRKLWIGSVALMLLLTLSAGYLGVKMFRPDLIEPDLRRELRAIGPVVGEATRDAIIARFGIPQQTYEEHLSTVYEFPEIGILIRLDRTRGVLTWYEFTGRSLATAKGIQIGASPSEVQSAYGPPSTEVAFGSRTRRRYHYGNAYVLEFWFGSAAKVERVVFFKS